MEVYRITAVDCTCSKCSNGLQRCGYEYIWVCHDSIYPRIVSSLSTYHYGFEFITIGGEIVNEKSQQYFVGKTKKQAINNYVNGELS
jgi:hypothetical protein